MLVPDIVEVHNFLTSVSKWAIPRQQFLYQWMTSMKKRLILTNDTKPMWYCKYLISV